MTNYDCYLLEYIIHTMTVIIQTWRSLNTTASNIIHALYNNTSWCSHYKVTQDYPKLEHMMQQ